MIRSQVMRMKLLLLLKGVISDVHSPSDTSTSIILRDVD